jgi:hypothetical protein
MLTKTLFATCAMAAGTNAAWAITLPDDIWQNSFEAPLTAPAEQWTFIPIDGALCGNGTGTGIGVNLNSASKRVLIYLEGGGECSSDLTCFELMTAAYFTAGYSSADFAVESTDTTSLAAPGGFFDRTATSNPFQDYNYVYVPYCTGDQHAGNNVVQYSMTDTGYHVGFANMKIFLSRIAATFPAADRVYLAGSDAGGFGAAFNWWQTQRRFGNVRVDLIDDSGVFMPPDIVPSDIGVLQAQYTNWNLAATLPPGCTACATSLDVILGYYATAFPNNHGALLAYSQDTVLPFDYGINSTQFAQGLTELTTDQFAPNPSLQYFINTTAASHVLWFHPTLSVNSVTVQQWLMQMTTDSPSWVSQ